MVTPTEATRRCINCQVLESEKDEPLKRCAHCPTAFYCSRECQKADWKIHKLVCARPPKPSPACTENPDPSAVGGHSPGFKAVNMLLGLNRDDSLHELSEKDVFAQLIDSFRLRITEEAEYGGNIRGTYADRDIRSAFGAFLDLAESREGILPYWWNKLKREECESMAADAKGWSDINCAVDKHQIVEHYEDILMPVMLRVLGEKIYGKGLT